MARIPYLDPDDLPEDQRSLLERPANLFRAVANSPAALRNLLRFGGWIRHHSALDSRLREMAILQVGYITVTEYEWSHHLKLASDFGVSEDDVRALVAEADGHGTGLPALDRAVLRAAREMTSDLKIGDATFVELQGALSAGEIVELCMVIGFYNLVVRVLHTLEVDLEPEYEPYLAKAPLPPKG
ncbi:MAG: carboxymuconolactone decarboxylase family protein [Acidimicrobiales bacterium]|nr:carboxymuconolactone decarboxylase family protein [Acidimicrobiales bacterium]